MDFEFGEDERKLSYKKNIPAIYFRMTLDPLQI